MSPPGHLGVSTKNVSPIGPAVWPAIGNIYTNVLFYYKEYGVTEVRSKILTPQEITGGNSFSLEGFKKMLFTI